MTTQLSTLPTQCKDLLANSDCYVVLDTEITGPRFVGEACDLAIVDPAGNVLFNKLLRPKCKIDPDTSAFHGITDEMVAGARTFAEEWPEIEAALTGRVIIAYNAEFDRARLEHTAKTHGITLPALQWRCFMVAYAKFWNEPNRYGRSDPAWQKLEAACKQQGIDFSQEHRALSDAQAVVALIQRLAELGSEARRYR